MLLSTNTMSDGLELAMIWSILLVDVIITAECVVCIQQSRALFPTVSMASSTFCTYCTSEKGVTCKTQQSGHSSQDVPVHYKRWHPAATRKCLHVAINSTVIMCAYCVAVSKHLFQQSVCGHLFAANALLMCIAAVTISAWLHMIGNALHLSVPATKDPSKRMVVRTT